MEESSAVHEDPPPDWDEVCALEERERETKQETISYVDAKQNDGKKSSSTSNSSSNNTQDSGFGISKAPAWQPDGTSDRCTVCAVKFTQTIRRHHCRTCGKLVCDKCSPHRETMPKEWGYRGKQRTCKKCRGDDVEDRGGAVDVGQEKGEEEERKDENKRSEAFDNSGSADANDSGARKLQDKEEEMEKSSVNGKTEKKKKDDNNDEPDESTRPVWWEADSSSNACRLCNRKWSATFRRHHCRRCGRLVCDECSPTRRVLPSQWGYKGSQRICRGCERQCYRHRGMITDWAAGAQETVVIARCSWCMLETTHRKTTDNVMLLGTNAIHECDHCGRTTKECSECQDAMAREPGSKSCVVCAEWVESWNNVEENLAKLSILQRYCSWCYELSDFERVISSKYQCSTCDLQVVECKKCEEGMCRATFGAKTCTKCKKENKHSWETLNKKKEEVFSRANSIEYIKGELKRDPHKETWKLISMNRKGIQAKTNEVIESISPVAHNCNWYETLWRVSKATFKKTHFKFLNYDQTINSCKSPKDELVPALELEFLESLAFMQDRRIEISHPEIVDMVERRMWDSAIDELCKGLDSAGLKTDCIRRFVVQTCVMAAKQNEGETTEESKEGNERKNDDGEITASEVADWKAALRSQLVGGSGFYKKAKTARALGAAGAGLVAKMAFNQLVLMAINPILGIGFIVFNIGYLVAKVTAGSDHSGLFVPTVLIVMQRLMLALQDINLQDYIVATAK